MNSFQNDRPDLPRAEASSDDLARRLDRLESPRPASQATRGAIKVALINAHVSSRLGVALVAIPAVFLLGVILRYGFGLNVPGFDALENVISVVEHTPAIQFLSPVILAGGPLLALALNILAILHVFHDHSRRELVLTIKLRPLNLSVITVALGIIAMLFVHIVSESARRPH
jgi:hypothetical protein